MTKKSILYIGNKLSKHGNTPTSVETLGNLLSEEFDIITVSDKKNKIFRLLDMIFSIIHNRNQLSLILIDTYSTSNFCYALICGWLAKQLKIPYIPILHGGNLPVRIVKNKKMSNFLFSNATMNIAPSGYLYDVFKKHNFTVQYIPNNIEISNYPFKQREKIKPKLLYVRAFSTIYNPSMAIRVLEHLTKSYPNTELCMVGPDKDGSLKDVKELSHELGVDKNVTFTGKLKKEDWIELSKKYDVFINTTNFDNTPVSVIEAMALGLPVVSTNVGGLPYLINDSEDGFLVEPDNTAEMVEKIDILINNPHLSQKVSARARKKVEEMDWEKVKEKWFNILQ